MNLRQATVQLARENPKLAKYLVPILRKTADDSIPEELLDKGALALMTLWEKAKLGGLTSFAAKKLLLGTGESTVPVPNGFDSLFKDIQIEVSREHGSRIGFRVGWSYNHPGGGSNGFSIGYIVYESDKQQWGWQINSPSRSYGYVD